MKRLLRGLNSVQVANHYNFDKFGKFGKFGRDVLKTWNFYSKISVDSLGFAEVGKYQLL